MNTIIIRRHYVNVHYLNYSRKLVTNIVTQNSIPYLRMYILRFLNTDTYVQRKLPIAILHMLRST